MARFVFRLRPVLEQRERVERDRQLAVAELERERLRLEDELRRCEWAAHYERRELRDRLDAGAGVDVGAARWQAHASLGAMSRARSAALRLAGVHARLGRARAALLGATAARKAVESLRDKQFAAWRAEQAKKERIELDEIGAIVTGRRAGDP